MRGAWTWRDIFPGVVVAYGLMILFFVWMGAEFQHELANAQALERQAELNTAYAQEMAAQLKTLSTRVEVLSAAQEVLSTSLNEGAFRQDLLRRIRALESQNPSAVRPLDEP